MKVNKKKKFDRYYIAVVHKDPDSDYGVSFPDFPGCITAGHTTEEAGKMAYDALLFHIRGMCEDGEEIRRPPCLRILQVIPNTLTPWHFWQSRFPLRKSKEFPPGE